MLSLLYCWFVFIFFSCGHEDDSQSECSRSYTFDRQTGLETLVHIRSVTCLLYKLRASCWHTTTMQVKSVGTLSEILLK